MFIILALQESRFSKNKQKYPFKKFGQNIKVAGILKVFPCNNYRIMCDERDEQNILTLLELPFLQLDKQLDPFGSAIHKKKHEM